MAAAAKSRVLEQVAGFCIPQVGEGLIYTCPMRGEVKGLQGTSFQSLLTAPPIKLGGLGLRSQVYLSPAAWVGGLEQALPSFGGEKGICPCRLTAPRDGTLGSRWS